jgi:beta-phosphoglucomutase family hydrolase
MPDRGAGNVVRVLGLPDSISVALFDLDGVLTSTAVLHCSAWKHAFDAFLAERDGDAYVPFTVQDYLTHVDGRPAVDGVRAFLAARGIDASSTVIDNLGSEENAVFLGGLRRGAAAAYPGSVRYLEALRQNGFRIGVVTSSKNARAVLDATGLTEFVEQRIDGVEIDRVGLRGKPAPDSFLACAAAFGVTPAEAAVFEDALSGVQAARAGGFGFVIGIDRVGADHAAAMRDAGADIVVGDPAELLPA